MAKISQTFLLPRLFRFVNLHPRNAAKTLVCCLLVPKLVSQSEADSAVKNELKQLPAAIFAMGEQTVFEGNFPRRNSAFCLN